MFTHTLAPQNLLHSRINVYSLSSFGKFELYLMGGPREVSRAESKRLILTLYLSVFCMAVAILYAVIDVSNGVWYSITTYILLFSASALSIVFIRRNKFKVAKVVLMFSANFVIFWTAINDPFETGAFLLFIPTGIAGFAILGFRENQTGIALSCTTAFLFLLAYLGDFQVLALDKPSETYIHISFIANFFISLVLSVLIVYFLMLLNKLSEDDLKTKETLAIQKNLELQKVNEELDRFVYSVSHDLRSPLSSILGLINIARHTDETQELKDILGMIEGRVKAQDHFIKEIIDYSRNARTETVHELVDLRTLIEDVYTSLKFSKNVDRITFENKIGENVKVFSDRIRLTVILNNLIGNSFKYHDPAKECPKVIVDVDLPKQEIIVSDNGTGMRQEHLEKIFQMFFRGSDRSAGSGLGLFIAKEAAVKIGGSIAVESKLGEGSKFMLRLPARSISAS